MARAARIRPMERYPLPRNRVLTLMKGDLTRQEVGAIVNAANEAMLGGGGVLAGSTGAPEGALPHG